MKKKTAARMMQLEMDARIQKIIAEGEVPKMLSSAIESQMLPSMASLEARLAQAESAIQFAPSQVSQETKMLESMHQTTLARLDGIKDEIEVAEKNASSLPSAAIRRAMSERFDKLERAVGIIQGILGECSLDPVKTEVVSLHHKASSVWDNIEAIEQRVLKLADKVQQAEESIPPPISSPLPPPKPRRARAKK